MKIQGLIILFFLSNNGFYGQNQSAYWQVVSKHEIISAYQGACSWFINTPSYYFKIKYASYKDHISKEKIESSEGYYKRVGNNLVSEAVGIKTLQNSVARVIIDAADEIVTVMNSATLNPALANLTELENLLTTAKNIRKMKIAKNTRFRIDFNKNDLYEAYEFLVNEKGIMEGLTYYYSEQIDRDNNAEHIVEKVMRPRLEISFFNFEIPALYKESEFSEENIKVVSKSEINLTGTYKDYRLIDYRLQTKK